jgi:hypothetical protein
MPPLIILVYAAGVYLLFLAVLLYAVGFFAGFGVPKGIDQGPSGSLPVAVGVDVLLRTQSLGGTYTAYRARVPALIPRLSLRHPAPESQGREQDDTRQAT